MLIRDLFALKQRDTTPSVEQYLRDGFEQVLGMSGTFSAKIVASLLEIQSSSGLAGDVAEIGVFEGRFLIAMALALSHDERAIGLDTWDWPDGEVRQRCAANLDRFGVAPNVDLMDAVTERDRFARDAEQKFRFIHIDADHTYPSLCRDLTLALDNIEPRGLICVDDMLSPAYPELYDAVRDSLRERDHWAVCCIIDREDIVASSKFLLCDSRMFRFYCEWLKARHAPHIWKMGARFAHHHALVLTPVPRLANVRT